MVWRRQPSRRESGVDAASRKRIGVGTQHPDLGDLIDALRAGDVSALDKIFDAEFKAVQYGALVTRFHPQDLDVAWPLVCDAVERYLRRGCEPAEAFNPWFNRILRRAAETVSQRRLSAGSAWAEDVIERDRLAHLVRRISLEFTPAEADAVHDHLLSRYLEPVVAPGPRNTPVAARKALSRAEAQLKSKVDRIVATVRLVIAAQHLDHRDAFCAPLTRLVAGCEAPLAEAVWKMVRKHMEL